jgi:hypothetical protein
LPHPAVDTFAQQIGVPAVTGVLFDPVDPELADSDAALAHPRAQILVRGQHGIGCHLFANKVGDGVFDQRLLGDGSLEGGIACAVQLRRGRLSPRLRWRAMARAASEYPGGTAEAGRDQTFTRFGHAAAPLH